MARASYLVHDWTSRSSSSFAWRYLHQGGRLDTTSGLCHFRNREYSPTLGRWVQVDPIGFAGGDVNLYRYLASVVSHSDGILSRTARARRILARMTSA
jgi:RHS repeat-associated protein